MKRAARGLGTGLAALANHFRLVAIGSRLYPGFGAPGSFETRPLSADREPAIRRLRGPFARAMLRRREPPEGSVKTDRELYRDVVDELGCDGRVGGMDVDVAVENGVVTLTGWVETLTQRLALERTVECIEGVRGLNVKVEIRTPLAPAASRQTATESFAT